jgi:hypothetical protein
MLKEFRDYFDVLPANRKFDRRGPAVYRRLGNFRIADKPEISKVKRAFIATSVVDSSPHPRKGEIPSRNL